MKPCTSRLAAAVAFLLSNLAGGGADATAQALPPAGLEWSTVVNNNEVIPGKTSKFNSYNQPSINAQGYVVFRARSKGPDPLSGLFVRDSAQPGSFVETVALRGDEVPAPNNTRYQPDDVLSSFIEFPSIPRIAYGSRAIASRGNFRPVWTYLTPEGETRAGTTGLISTFGGSLRMGLNTLGAVPAPETPEAGVNWFPHFAVPGAAPGTKFDVFPGSPSITDSGVMVFKGNYTEGTGKTGVFFRSLEADEGLAPVQLIANTGTVIPNLPEGVSDIRFGSTAPPSAAGCEVVFTGYDNEASPTYGGIYLAELRPEPELQTLVGIGDPVPGETGATFTQFGEALSFDGRYVSFWGAWGAEKVTLWLDCPTDGNADLLAYCREFVGDNFPVEVPAHQGIFVHDTRTGVTTRITTNAGDFNDFLFWTFSGRPPGVGESDDSDGEPPRWRASAFTAVSAGPGNTFKVAFKARTGSVDPDEHAYVEPVDGIYLSDGATLSTVLSTGQEGRSVDPAAPEGSVVTTLAIERESLRGRWLAVTAGMVDPVTTESMAGIYATQLVTPVPLRAGSYRGLVLDTRSVGLASLNVRRTGSYSARLVLGDTTYTASGRLGANGEGTTLLRHSNHSTRQMTLVTVSHNGFTELLIQVAPDENLVSDPDASGTLTGSAAFCPYPTPEAVPVAKGQFTLSTLLPDVLIGDSQTPQGHAALIMSHSVKGRLSVAGRLGDGAAATGTMLVTEDGRATLYLRPYGNTGGRCLGDLSFLEVPAQSDVEGRLDWVKPASRTGTGRYAAGFDLSCVDAIGCRYEAPRNITGMLELGSTRVVDLSFSNEDLNPGAGIVSAVINAVSTPVGTNPPLRSLSMNPTSGVFLGYLSHDRRLLYYRGVILQKLNIGLGSILGAEHSGPVRLDVRP